MGCVVGLGLLLWVSSCVFGGADDPKPAPTPTPSTVALSAPAGDTIISAGDGKQVGSTLLEQAILDAFPTKASKGKQAKRTASDAANYVGAAINAAGHLCAQPIEAQRVASGQYGIGCIKYRGSGMQVNYIVDVRSGNVSEL